MKHENNTETRLEQLAHAIETRLEQLARATETRLEQLAHAIETRLEQLDRAIDSDDSFVNRVMSRLETSSDTTQKPKPTFVRRLFMKPITKFAAAAA